MPLAGHTWDSTALVAKSELSASIRKGLVESGEMRTGADVTLCLSRSNADCLLGP